MVPKRRDIRKAEDEEEYLRVRLPNETAGELFGIAEQLLGASRLKVVCADGKSRMCRIPGRLRKRLWIREGDLVVVKPWAWQDEKADIIWRYTRTEASNLSRRKLLPESIDIF
jgi:translation initiation factor 1A